VADVGAPCGSSSANDSETKVPGTHMRISEDRYFRDLRSILLAEVERWLQMACLLK